MSRRPEVELSDRPVLDADRLVDPQHVSGCSGIVGYTGCDYDETGQHIT